MMLPSQNASVVHKVGYRTVSTLRRLLDAEHPTLPVRGRLRRAAALRLQAYAKMLLDSPPKRDGFTLSAYGVWLSDREADKTFWFCVRGSYGFAFANLLRRWGAPYVLLDVGANIGVYSLIAACYGQAERVVAFEPDPQSAALLRCNAKANAADVEIIEAAVSRESGTACLFIPEGHSGAASLGNPSVGAHSVPVRCMAASDLDDIVGTPPEGQDVLVKLDVEGHEYEALEALSAWGGWRGVQVVWVEFSEATDVSASVDLLERAGFVRTFSQGTSAHSDVLFVRDCP